MGRHETVKTRNEHYSHRVKHSIPVRGNFFFLNLFSSNTMLVERGKMIYFRKTSNVSNYFAIAHLYCAELSGAIFIKWIAIGRIPPALLTEYLGLLPYLSLSERSDNLSKAITIINCNISRICESKFTFYSLYSLINEHWQR